MTKVYKCVWCLGTTERRKALRRPSYKSRALYHPECLAEKEANEPEIKRVNYQNHRAMVAGLPYGLTHHDWILVLESYGRVCVYCGGEYQELEHIVSIQDGGGTVKDNVVPACRSCNRKKKYRALEMVVKAKIPAD